MADMQIKELFALDIERPIEEVIKVDQDDAHIVHGEISDYVVTDSILKHYLKILHKYWETKNKPHEGIGIWVSGFFGSGKSSFAKMLGLALQNRDVEPESVDPWHFPTPESYRPLLEAEGFRVEQIQLFPRPTPLPGELLDWLEVFAGSFISALPDSERQPYLLEVCHALRPKLCDATGPWTVDYVRLRFVAHLPEQE